MLSSLNTFRATSFPCHFPLYIFAVAPCAKKPSLWISAGFILLCSSIMSFSAHSNRVSNNPACNIFCRTPAALSIGYAKTANGTQQSSFILPISVQALRGSEGGSIGILLCEKPVNSFWCQLSLLCFFHWIVSVDRSMSLQAAPFSNILNSFSSCLIRLFEVGSGSSPAITDRKVSLIDSQQLHPNTIPQS